MKGHVFVFFSPGSSDKKERCEKRERCFARYKKIYDDIDTQDGGRLAMAEGKDLLQVLWSGADVLRGKMDANEYKTYLLGLVFYKYLSDSYLAKVYDLIRDESPDSLEEAQCVYEDAMESDDAEELLSEIKKSKHYTLDPDMTYVSILNAANL